MVKTQIIGDMRAYDLLVQAEAGLCSVTGSPEAPAKVGVSAADIATGMNAHALILEALIARGRTGQGQAIEVAMFDGVADWMSVPLVALDECRSGDGSPRHVARGDLTARNSPPSSRRFWRR